MSNLCGIERMRMRNRNATKSSKMVDSSVEPKVHTQRERLHSWSANEVNPWVEFEYESPSKFFSKFHTSIFSIIFSCIISTPESPFGNGCCLIWDFLDTNRFIEKACFNRINTGYTFNCYINDFNLALHVISGEKSTIQ